MIYLTLRCSQQRASKGQLLRRQSFIFMLATTLPLHRQPLSRKLR